MHVWKAYERREQLPDAELERLYVAVIDELTRYRAAIRNYPPGKMASHGAPHLSGLEAKAAEVGRLLTLRGLAVPPAHDLPPGW